MNPFENLVQKFGPPLTLHKKGAFTHKLAYNVKRVYLPQVHQLSFFQRPLPMVKIPLHWSDNLGLALPRGGRISHLTDG